MKRQRILEFQQWTDTLSQDGQTQPLSGPVADPTQPQTSTEPIDSQIHAKIWGKQNIGELPSEIAGDIEAANVGKFTLYYSTNNLGVTSNEFEGIEKSLESYLGDSVVDFELNWDQDKKLTVTGDKVKDMGSAEDYQDDEVPSAEIPGGSNLA